MWGWERADAFEFPPLTNCTMDPIYFLLLFSIGLDYNQPLSKKKNMNFTMELESAPPPVTVRVRVRVGGR